MTEKKICKNKIDAHAHAYRTDFPDKKLVYMPDPERLKEIYKDIGVSHALLLPLVAPERRAFFCPTEHVMEIAKSDPEAFSFAMALDPRMLHDGEKSDFSPLIEYYLSKGAKSVGEMQANIPFDSPLFDNLFSQIAKYKLPVTLHLSPAVGHEYGVVDAPGLPGLERALKKFPNIIFIGHSQSFWAHISEVRDRETMKGYPKGKVTPGRIRELMDNYPNLYCDLSAGSGFNALTRDEEYGLGFLSRYSDRLMFACDLCDATGALPPLAGWLDRQYLDGNLDETAYLNVCRNTAARVFSME
ncbi:MAG: amidohydrolase family protein [Clostridia bacterium]|nr:amidohydrolase family protein [Clostridia bacterium]